MYEFNLPLTEADWERLKNVYLPLQHSRRWEKSELEQLKELITHKSIEEIAQILNRTVVAIKSKLYKLNLKQIIKK